MLIHLKNISDVDKKQRFHCLSTVLEYDKNNGRHSSPPNQNVDSLWLSLNLSPFRIVTPVLV